MVLPAKIRAQLGETGMVGMADGCLGLWTLEGFDAIADRLAAAVDGRRGRARRCCGSSWRTPARSPPTSRAASSSPRSSATYAGLGSEVVVNGRRDRAEIWAKETLGGARRLRAPRSTRTPPTCGDTFAALRF